MALAPLGPPRKEAGGRALPSGRLSPTPIPKPPEPVTPPIARPPEGRSGKVISVPLMSAEGSPGRGWLRASAEDKGSEAHALGQGPSCFLVQALWTLAETPQAAWSAAFLVIVHRSPGLASYCGKRGCGPCLLLRGVQQQGTQQTAWGLVLSRPWPGPRGVLRGQSFPGHHL